MARIACKVGFVVGNVETSTDIFEEKYEEHLMKGELVKLYKMNQAGDQRYDDMTFGNEFSLVGGEFAFSNFSNIRYVVYLGQKWKVTGVEVKYPRLILSVGGILNEQ